MRSGVSLSETVMTPRPHCPEFAGIRGASKDGYKKVTDALNKMDPKNRDHFPTLKGHPVAQQHAEQVIHESHDTLKKGIKTKTTMKKEFKIYRWSPDSPHNKPFLQSYFIDLSNCGPMVLDVLQKLRGEEDSSLSYRRSYREANCGSRAMVRTRLRAFKPIDADTSRAYYNNSRAPYVV